MAESRAVQKSLPHELIDRFADSVAPTLGRSVALAEPGRARIGGRMVRVRIQYAEGEQDP